MTGNKEYIDIPSVYLAVDDKTRHYFYLRAQKRSEKEISTTIHKKDFEGSTVSRAIRVNNGRLVPEQLTIDDASFELIDCPTELSTSDFYKIQKGEEDAQRYYDEIAAVVKKKLGCDKVICFNHQVRNQDKVGEDGVAGYAGFSPHTDSSPVNGDELAILMAGSGEDVSKYERYAYINLWRNITDEPVENDHLAMLDERTTVKPDDYITKDLFGDGYSTVQYGLNARHVKNHKWFYFPQMKKDEAIIFKQMDSDHTKTGRICFHMSINDPSISKSYTRQSIEVRMMCYWNKTKDEERDTMPTKENTNSNMLKDPEEYARSLAQAQQGSGASFSELLQKIPVLNWFFTCNDGNGSKSTYTGSPSDYLDTFVNAMDFFPYWGPGKSWAKSVMKQNKGSLDKGIAEITVALVDDSAGFQKTKNFQADEKKQIVNFLLANERFTEVAKKHLKDLA